MIVYLINPVLIALGILIGLVALMLLASMALIFIENLKFNRSVKRGDIILDGHGGGRSKDGREIYVVSKGNLKTSGHR